MTVLILDDLGGIDGKVSGLAAPVLAPEDDAREEVLVGYVHGYRSRIGPVAIGGIVLAKGKVDGSELEIVPKL